MEAGRDETRRGRTRGVVRGKHSRSDGRSTGVGPGTVPLLLGPISLGMGCPLRVALAAPVDGALPDRARVTTLHGVSRFGFYLVLVSEGGNLFIDCRVFFGTTFS